MGSHVKFSQVDGWSIQKIYCPTCEKHRYFWSWYEHFYGWDHTCLKCGERWQDDEMCERPFLRAWRIKSVESAKKHARRTIAAGIPSEINMEGLQ